MRAATLARMPLVTLSPPQIGALLASALAGDRAAQERLIREVLYPVVHAAVRGHLFGRSLRYFDREDAVQSVLMHLWDNGAEKLREYRATQAPFVSFLFGVTIGWIYDHTRRMTPPDPVEDPERDAAPDSGPARRAQIGVDLSAAVDALDDDTRVLFWLVYLEECSQAEIAEMLGLSLHHAVERIRAMEKKLKKLLAENAVSVRTPQVSPSKKK